MDLQTQFETDILSILQYGFQRYIINNQDNAHEDAYPQYDIFDDNFWDIDFYEKVIKLCVVRRHNLVASFRSRHTSIVPNNLIKQGMKLTGYYLYTNALDLKLNIGEYIYRTYRGKYKNAVKEWAQQVYGFTPK